MYKETKLKMGDAALKKSDFLNQSLGQYLVSSAWAGALVGFGIFLIMVIGGIGVEAGSPYTKILMGVSFGVALSLVIMSGTEIFTGNNMIMTVGALDGKVTWKDLFKVWGASYIGNFLGAFLIGGLFVVTQIESTATGNFILSLANAKVNQDFWVLLVKGILCNILVCMAVLSTFRFKSETARLIMTFWCLFAFITSGFEHSVANMTVFAMSFFMGQASSVTIAGMAANLIPVTLGNIVGGALILGTSIYYMGRAS